LRQPLVAREVSEQLAKAHPDRATSAQTVRNGLQTLVSKNLAEKTRQQGNVMYTAHTDAPAAPSPAGDQPASGEAEKVPAEV
jgi:predicted transcriptional regulator